MLTRMPLAACSQYHRSRMYSGRDVLQHGMEGELQGKKCSDVPVMFGAIVREQAAVPIFIQQRAL